MYSQIEEYMCFAAAFPSFWMKIVYYHGYEIEHGEHGCGAEWMKVKHVKTAYELSDSAN